VDYDHVADCGNMVQIHVADCGDMVQIHVATVICHMAKK
jgi:hypothetical protein